MSQGHEEGTRNYRPSRMGSLRVLSVYVWLRNCTASVTPFSSSASRMHRIRKKDSCYKKRAARELNAQVPWEWDKLIARPRPESERYKEPQTPARTRTQQRGKRANPSTSTSEGEPKSRPALNWPTTRCTETKVLLVNLQKIKSHDRIF